MNTVRKETGEKLRYRVYPWSRAVKMEEEGPVSFLPMGEIKACLSAGGKVLEEQERDPVQGTGSARSRCSNHLRILGNDGSLVAQRVKRLPEMWETRV